MKQSRRDFLVRTHLRGPLRRRGPGQPEEVRPHEPLRAALGPERLSGARLHLSPGRQRRQQHGHSEGHDLLQPVQAGPAGDLRPEHRLGSSRGPERSREHARALLRAPPEPCGARRPLQRPAARHRVERRAARRPRAAEQHRRACPRPTPSSRTPTRSTAGRPAAPTSASPRAGAAASATPSSPATADRDFRPSRPSRARRASASASGSGRSPSTPARSTRSSS